jgi:hypothetical protein
LLVLLAWVFFRADSFNEAILIIRKILSFSGSLFLGNPSNLIFSVIGIISLVAVDFKREYYNSSLSILNSKYPYVRIAGIVFLVITILLVGVLDGGQFIYFQF